jgi:hypothetical protein
MALSMPRPFATKQGSFYLNVKVPLALRPLAKGQRVSLPAGDEHHSVVIGDKVSRWHLAPALGEILARRLERPLPGDQVRAAMR